MLKKYHQLLIGIIIGSLLTGGLAFSDGLRNFLALEADFPIIVNGVQAKFDMPIVTIEDRTYLPLRALGDILGVPVEWDVEKGQVEVGDRRNMDGFPRFENERTIYYDLNGVKYLQVHDALLNKTKNLSFDFSYDSNNDIKAINIIDRNQYINNERVVILLEDAEFFNINDCLLFKEDYFNDVLLPLDERLESQKK